MYCSILKMQCSSAYAFFHICIIQCMICNTVQHVYCPMYVLQCSAVRTYWNAIQCVLFNVCIIMQCYYICVIPCMQLSNLKAWTECRDCLLVNYKSRLQCSIEYVWSSLFGAFTARKSSIRAGSISRSTVCMHGIPSFTLILLLSLPIYIMLALSLLVGWRGNHISTYHSLLEQHLKATGGNWARFLSLHHVAFKHSLRTLHVSKIMLTVFPLTNEID